MPMICPPESLHCPSVKAFKFVFDGAVLQNWRGASVWEPNTSFFTYTKLWLIARDWDMPEMLAAAQFNMADLAIDLSLRGSYLLGAAELDRQSKHLASFVQSAMLASSLAGDAPAIYAGLVDLGSMLAGKLSWCPSLKDWAAERGGDGEAFARDIGAM
ncbi:hypothetical protein GGR56DRAFT_613823 [Xylariaceae sp. FL0804]|nr:hypothetical protein GGR56DRAFT_613823 [Xylariaceae sp. FL0804]